MASLENLHCPQYVDFTCPEAFELNDGADFFFEKGVVGQMDLGFGNTTSFKSEKTKEEENAYKNDDMQEQVDKLKTMTNFNLQTKQPFATSTVANTKKNEIDDSNPNEEKTTPTLPACIAIYKSEKQNKENQAAQIANNNRQQTTSAKVTPTLPACISGYKSEKQNKEANNSASVKTTQVTPTLIKQNNNDPCNVTFSVTPTATKPISVDESSNSSINFNKQLSKQESIERGDQKNRAPSSSTPQPLQDLKSKPVILSNSGNQTNIVKKTLAKMTAAFKQRNNNENLTLKNKLSIESKKQSKPGNEPLRVESNLQRKKSNEMFGNRAISPESDHESSNRRASSVPRTLREKQALGIVVLKSIEDSSQNKHVSKDDSVRNMTPSSMSKSEHKSLKNKVGPPTAILSIASSAKKKQISKQQQQKQHEERRRSRSCNESISNPRTNRHARRSTNETIEPVKPETGSIPKPRVAASPGSSQIKPRPKSGERGNLLPMYTGVKFVPKMHSHKYSNMEGACFAPLIPNQISVGASGAATNAAAGAVSKPDSTGAKSLPLEEVLKQRPICMQKRPVAPNSASSIKIDLSKKSLLANRSISGKSASFKYQPNSNNTSTCVPKPNSTSLVKTSSSSNDLNLNSNHTSHNTSANSTMCLDASRVRKKSETRQQQNSSSNGFLHTELRALKRQEYDHNMKEKEKIALQMKQELDIERLKKQQEEIQKIRMQRTFRSNPIKHYKPVELKPSDKPLTEPKSPQLSVSTTKLANLSLASKNDSFNIRSFSALVDAPIRNKPTSNSNLFRSNSLMRNQKQRNMANSHDDIRF